MKGRAAAIRAVQRPARTVRVPDNVMAAECIGPLLPGMRVVGLTKGQFSLLDMVEAVQAATGPADVTISTWTIAESDSKRVARFLAGGQFRSFTLVIDRSFPARYPQYCSGILERFGPEAIRMTRTHAKFGLIGAGDWRISIRTSMNLNPNPRCEQFELDDDAAIYRFFEEYVSELMVAVPAGLDVDGGTLHAEFKAIFAGEAVAARERHELEGITADLNRWMG